MMFETFFLSPLKGFGKLRLIGIYRPGMIYS